MAQLRLARALCAVMVVEAATAFVPTKLIQSTTVPFHKAATSSQQHSTSIHRRQQGVIIMASEQPQGLLEEPHEIPVILEKTFKNATDSAVAAAVALDNLQETVGAVLAVTEDAAMAAEASLPAEVRKEVDYFGNNGTETSTTPMPIVQAKEIVGEPLSAPIEAPPVMKILKFAVPAVGVWLCSPLLSLIDTSAVGLLAGTTQQAALNPAVAVTDYAALLMAFLYTATTNIVAAAQESDRLVSGKPKTTRAMIGAMKLSTFVGAGLAAVLLIFTKQLLRGIIGNDAIDPAVFAAASKYVQIRALGMPAAAIIGSAQAACLGMQDIKSPLYVLAAAAVVNFFGDMMFVGCNHPLIGGAAGAAWATVFSQYAALAIFVKWLTHKTAPKKKPAVKDLTNNILDIMNDASPKGETRRSAFQESLQKTQQKIANVKKAASGLGSGLFGKLNKSKSKATTKATAPIKNKDDTFSVRGLLADRFKGTDLLKLPPKDVAGEFKDYVIPVTTTQVGRVSGYVAMAHVVSSSLGTVSMAAQQVIVSFFYCLCPIADSLSLTAQSFIPGIVERKVSQERSDALRKTATNFMKAGGIFGAVMTAAIGLLPVLSRFFTTDPAVVSLVNLVMPFLAGFFLVHGVLCAAEGILLGQKDLGFLGKMYGAYFVAVPFFMMRVKRVALSGVQGINLSSVWSVFLAYQLFRFAAWVARVVVMQRRTDRAVAALEETI